MIEVHFAQGNYEALFGLGNVFLGERRFDQAVECFRKALQLKPDHGGALQNLGIALHSMGLFREAHECLTTLVRLTPDNPAAHFYSAMTSQALGLQQEAIHALQECLRLKPSSAEAWHRLAILLHQQGRIADATGALEKAVAAAPRQHLLHNDLGILLAQQGRMREAISHFEQAVKLQSRFVDAYCNLGAALHSEGRLAEAQKCYKKALSIKQDHSRAHCNLGLILKDNGKTDEAIACFRKALSFSPNDVQAHDALANALREKGLLEESIQHYRSALAVDPDFHTARMNLAHQLQNICDWSELAALTNQLKRCVLDGNTAANVRISPFSFLALPGTTAHEQKMCAQQWAEREYGPFTSLRETLAFRFERSDEPRIHIGYLSADFHRHATAVLMAELFEKHDRSRFRITAYSYGPNDGSEMRQRLERAFDAFVDVQSLTVTDIAKRINTDRVDILVDLKGYTRHNRCGVMALRPAPIQVNYLGYPGTLGADFIDYLIADEFIIPPDMQQHYAERVLYLPDCYQPNDRSRPRPPAPSRAALGLPEDAFVFCCFNQSYKLSPDVFATWCQLLRDVPNSVLWLMACNTLAEQNIKQILEQEHIAAERLVIARRVPEYEHLARLQCADLFLDTLPVNAHTSCSEALWMGLPVLTCAGDTFPARVAGSLLHAMGLEELVTHTLEDYRACALALARNPERLRDLRERIAARRDTAPLFDSSRFAANLDALYARVWQDYLASRPQG